MDSQKETGASFFPEHGLGRWLLLLCIFAAALGVRLYNADSPPMDFHPIRQYRSYLLARAIYDAPPGTVSESDRDIALAAKPALLEPPITEYIASFFYRIFGGESFIIPRSMSIVFWLIAGIFIYLLAKDLISPDGGIISAAFFLFLPYAVRASRSFQPDPLMIMMFTASIFAVYKYYERPSGNRLAAACIVAAIAVLVKPVCLFPIFGAFFMTRIPERNIRKIFLSKDLYIFTAACVLPTLIYYGYGIYSAGMLKNQAGFTFMPELLKEPFFWKGWLKMITRVVGLWPIALSLIGIILLSTNTKRFFVIGLWAGYFIHGLYFTFHIHTHDYYQLILIPIVALSLGQTAAVLLRNMTSAGAIWRTAVWFLFVISILFALRESLLYLSDAGFAKEVKIYEEIGEKVNHSKNILTLDKNYGNGLMYHGKVVGLEEQQWPVTYDLDFGNSINSKVKRGKELLDEIILDRSPEYFIVTYVTDYDLQSDLKEALDSGYDVIAQTPDYIIYDLRHEKNTGTH